MACFTDDLVDQRVTAMMVFGVEIQERAMVAAEMCGRVVGQAHVYVHLIQKLLREEQ